ncbi:nucleotide exchange factor GrpE [Hymenobacter sp. BRD128]|uniref:nucleotide exchange factor GrpE n=1 Tax=Hymenobacter sp. BRD128 TaxID=2675878 RepID=UPI001562FF5B|nr:nucleotide exchange factor GrpE [Hymenobacter sp. BRD128]QKG55547.1 nucleotide exchange factor GrpE [Hymenobacter sp. BRD128]
MTDDKTMNLDDQPLTDNTAEHTAGEQDLAIDATTPEAGASAGASRAETELADLKDKYLRLAAEFENYKRRTAKERADLFKTANQELMVALLPVLDDFDRARQHTQDTQDPAALQNALDITYNKLTKTLQQKGLAPMNAKGGDFDAELHEAITQIPAPSDDLRGKIVEEIEKGYYLGDKVIRHAKVVLGQ